MLGIRTRLLLCCRNRGKLRTPETVEGSEHCCIRLHWLACTANGLDGWKAWRSVQHSHQHSGRRAAQPDDYRVVWAGSEVHHHEDLGYRMSDTLVDDEEIDHSAPCSRAASGRAGSYDRASEPVQPGLRSFIASQLFWRDVEVARDEPGPAVADRRVTSRVQQLEVAVRDSFRVPEVG